MALSPQTIREQRFKPSRRGYDPAEVDKFRAEVADALEAAQNEATAMEARARAAVARLQELSQSREAGEEATPARAERPAPVRPSVDETETISRTLLLAQRTADETVAQAKAEAERLLADARSQAAAQLEAARAEAEGLVESARQEARRAGESERVRVEGEVQALLARRDFLESDVEHLEQFIAAQRERITEAVAELTNIIQRVPNGLGDLRRPLLSAAADEPAANGESVESEIAEITRVAEGSAPADDTASGEVAEPAAEAAAVTGNGDGAEEEPAAVADPAAETASDTADETGDIWARRDEPSGPGTGAATADDPTALFDPDERT